MLRKLIILGVCAGSSAALPVIYQSHPETFIGFARGLLEDEAVPQAVGMPAPRRDAAPQATGRTVAIPADATGHFRADFKINGFRTAGMVDTGATLVALNERTARKLGVKLKASDFRHEVQTANGTARAAVARLDSLAIGRIHVENVEAVVLEDAALDGTLIGMSFLRRLDAYRVEDNTLLLKQ